MIALLYSSNLQGEYEHCGCPSHPLGGLVRRATVIDQARAEADGVLIVDAGDLLLPPARAGAHLQPPAPAEVERRARLILTSYARMGVHAVLPGETDLAMGPAKLQRLLKSLRVPAVASNLVRDDGSRLFDRDRLVTIAGVTIGIFGVVRTLPPDEPPGTGTGARLRVLDPVATAREEVAALKARGAKMIVALLHVGSPEAARRLLESVPGITWAVLGHSGLQLETPEKIGEARLVEAMSLGKLAGRLDIHLLGGDATFTDRGERAQMLSIIDDHRRQLVDLERRADEDKTNQLRAYYNLRRDGLMAALQREVVLVAKLPSQVRGSWFENRIIPLDDSIVDHPGVAPLVAAYNEENARRAVAGLPVGVATKDLGAPVPMPPPGSPTANADGSDRAAAEKYAGSAACASCHPSAWRVFRGSKHAHALASLVAVRRDRDPTCVACHSTGYLRPGGTASIREATLRFRDVGCESCHGPSLEHLTSADGIQRKATTRRQVEQTVCLGCHTPDQTNGEFDYERFRAAILAPGHGAASPP